MHQVALRCAQLGASRCGCSRLSLVHTLLYDRARPRPRLSDRAGVSLCKCYEIVDSMVEATCLWIWEFTTHIIDLCADDEEPSQLIIRPGWDAPHVRCSPRTFCAWPCLLRQVGTVLGSPYDYVVAGLAYANPGSRHNVDANMIYTSTNEEHVAA